MRVFRHRCLMFLGLAASLTCLPQSMTTASELSADSLTVPASAASLRAQTEPTLEPGEEPLPLEADDPPEESTDFDGPGGLIPQSERPTEEGFDEPPDYLVPVPNPLLTPTQPEDVEIIGTQPLSLETAIELAYRNNEQLRITQLELERAAAGLRAELAQLLPTLDLSAGIQTGDQLSVSSIQANADETITIIRGGIRTEYDVGISGERAARIRAARDQVRLAELRVEQVRAELRLATIDEYYAVQEAIEDIRINQAFLEEAERNLRDTVLREEVGVGTRFDVLRADVQVANARQALTQSISQRQISQRRLASRLNVPPNIGLTTLPVELAGTWPLSLEESIVLAYQNRAELEQFLVQREFNQEQRQIALARVRPNLGLFAEYNLQDVLSTGGVSDDAFTLGAQLSWRLYDGGAARARAEQAEKDVAIDESEFENARNQIRFEVEQAYFTLLANQENIDTASLAVEQAQEALELANLRFNAGVGTQLDVLSATRELTEAQGNLLTAVLEYNRALARLERAVSNLADIDAVEEVIDL